MDYSDKARRPMSEALRTAKLTEDALNFLAGPAGQPPAAPVPAVVQQQASASVDALVAPNPPAPLPHPTIMLTKSPPHLAVVVPAIVSMTFRLPASLTARLARVAAERKLQRERPFSQQDIVAVALDDWLQQNGYSK